MWRDPARLYLWSGLVWDGALRAYWVSLVVRITIGLGLPSLQLVLLGTVMELALLVAEVPTGVVADTVSRKWSVIVGFVVVGAAQLASGVVETFPLLVATQILWGVGYTFRSGAETAWITDELGGPDEVEALILRRAQLQQGVAMASIIVGAGLARLTSLTISIVVTGGALVATGAVLALSMPETGFRPARRGAAAPYRALATTLRSGAGVALTTPALRVLVAVLVLVGLASEAIDRLDVRRLDQLGLSARLDEVVLVAAMAVAQAVVGLVMLTAARRRVSGSGVPVALAAVLAISALGVAVLGLVAVLPLAIVGLVVQGGLRHSTTPLVVNWANAHAPGSVRATVLSFIEQATSVGEIGGGVLLGAVAVATTVPTAMTVSMVLLVGSAALALVGSRRWAPLPAPVGGPS
jgi:MFS family permease